MGFWNVEAVTASEPLSEDMLYDAAAAVAGDVSPELRDRYRLCAIEARTDAQLRTLAEIRALPEA